MGIKCCKKCGGKVEKANKSETKYATWEMICREIQCPRCKGKNSKKCRQCEGKGTISHETLFYQQCAGIDCPFRAVYKLYKNSKFEELNRKREDAKKQGSCTRCYGKGRVSISKV